METTNYQKSAAAVVIKGNKVLLARHTYGTGNGKLIIPGGYLNENETPEDAVKREVFEETKIKIELEKIIGIRFNNHDWYVVFSAKYKSGKEESDNDENSEVIWMELNEVEGREDVSELTKKLIKSYLGSSGKAFEHIEYSGNTKSGPYSFYGIK